jgi:hypothetical protein
MLNLTDVLKAVGWAEAQTVSGGGPALPWPDRGPSAPGLGSARTGLGRLGSIWHGSCTWWKVSSTPAWAAEKSRASRPQLA